MYLKTLLLCAVLFLQHAFALLDEPLLAFKSGGGAIEIHRATILYDEDDTAGIRIAANSLADDYKEITGRKPRVVKWEDVQLNRRADADAIGDVAIIAATVDSPLIKQLEDDNKIKVDGIRGKWETFRTSVVKNPLPGVRNAFVIAGSDMRGTMFGLYTLAEQSGQSP